MEDNSMSKCKLTFLCAAALAAFSLYAAPAAKIEKVAEGYPNWLGVVDANYLYGRNICSSDLRHKAAIIIFVEAGENMEKQLDLCVEFSYRNSGVPPADTVWETLDNIPRQSIVLVSVIGKVFKSKFVQRLKDKGNGNNYLNTKVSFYNNVTLVGEPEEFPGFPYVMVMDPKSPVPAWKGKYSQAESAKVLKAFFNAKKNIPEWTPLYGVAAPAHFEKARQQIAARKLDAARKTLMGGFSNTDAAVRAEAQMMYDAIEQYRSDLLFRIQQEYVRAPARAFADLQILLKLFPNERRKIQEIDSKLKGKIDATVIGKIFEKMITYSQPDYSPKPSELKKNIAEVMRWKKMLAPLKEYNNVSISSQAMLVESQLDSLLENLKAKTVK
jgi:hypothetical protein